jgi:hypothetical protein
MLLGTVITHLQDEAVALDTLLAIGDLALLARVRDAAEVEGLALGEFISDAVGQFIQGADDEAWLALMTSASRAEDPGSAGLKCMLDHTLSRVHRLLAADSTAGGAAA